MDLPRATIAERAPAYLESFNQVMKPTKGHRFNMFVMWRPILDAYCTRLFDILFELERRLDISSYSAYDARVFGFVAERLLDVWLKTNQVSFRELPVLNLESQHWLTKILAFLRRNFRGDLIRKMS